MPGLDNGQITINVSPGATGFGKIGTLTLQFNSFEQDQEVALTIENPFLINHLGEKLEVIGLPANTTLLGTLTPTENLNLENTVSIFPNPTDGIINIHTDLSIHHFQLYDLYGRLIISGAEDVRKINVQDLPVGVYLSEVSW